MYPIFLSNTDDLLANNDVVKITEFPTNDGQLTLLFGETTHLNCSGIATSPLTQFLWRHGNGTLVCPVRENPFCVPSNFTICGQTIYNGGCRVDVLNGRRCRGLRIHSYTYGTVEDCVYDTLRKQSTMVINGVTWSDAGVYTCVATVPRKDISKTVNVTIG